MTSFLAFVMMSCAVLDTTTPIPETSPPIMTNTSSATVTPTHVENSTPTTSSENEEGQKLVKELLENNGGCKLPCWWGITPGKTTWTEARKILEKVSLSIGGQESAEIFSVSVHALLPYPYDFAPYMEHLYGVKNGVVDYIRVYNFDLAPNYYLHNFLAAYGQPTEIWMRTYSKYEMGLHPFLVDLFYQDKGILIEYSTGEPLKEIDGKLQNCMIKEMDSPFIHLWSPEKQNLSFQDAKKFVDTTNLPEPIPLLESTGMDVRTFYETFKNPDTDACLETPNDLWP
jgi:hypothetical protein